MSPKERESYYFFLKFITRVDDGLEFEDDTGFEMNLEAVYKWLTGSSIKIANGDNIEVLFHPARNDTVVPRPVVKTCPPGSLKLPIVDSYETMELVCCEAVECAAHGFTLV